jgi:hypothetical protein
VEDKINAAPLDIAIVFEVLVKVGEAVVSAQIAKLARHDDWVDWETARCGRREAFTCERQEKGKKATWRLAPSFCSVLAIYALRTSCNAPLLNCLPKYSRTFAHC